MIKSSEPILFFGNERIATGVSTTAPTLQKLIKAGYTVSTVIANNSVSASRRQRDLEIATVAKMYDIPVLLPQRLNDIKDEIIKYNAKTAILVAYGKIIPQSIIDLFPNGIINIHPSLLPLHRGPTPIESVILNGETKTGVSVMQLVKEMDAGPVYAQKELPVQGAETKQQLADKLLTMGGDLLIETLPLILTGQITPTIQDDNIATYDRLISKEDGIIDWSKPAYTIEREIRAYAGWPGSRAIISNKEIIITKANTVPDDHSEKPGKITAKKHSLRVYCGKGLLEIKSLKPQGKQEMDISAFLAGYGQKLTN